MKKLNICLISFSCLVFMLLTFPILSYAENEKKVETEIGIELEDVPKKNNTKPPLIDGGNDKKNDNLFLPKTGELLSSLIIILLGISLLIFSLGVITIKQFYQRTRLED